MLIRLMGRAWRLLFVPRREIPGCDGLCDDPCQPGKAIKIRDSLRGERLLDVLLHEMLHAGQWHLDEQFVAQLARDQARVLWRLGYRGPKDIAHEIEP